MSTTQDPRDYLRDAISRYSSVGATPDQSQEKDPKETIRRAMERYGIYPSDIIRGGVKMLEQQADQQEYEKAMRYQYGRALNDIEMKQIELTGRRARGEDTSELESSLEADYQNLQDKFGASIQEGGEPSKRFENLREKIAQSRMEERKKKIDAALMQGQVSLSNAAIRDAANFSWKYPVDTKSEGRAWRMGDQETMDRSISDIRKQYGVSEKDAEEIYTKHRHYANVAIDMLRGGGVDYDAMKEIPREDRGLFLDILQRTADQNIRMPDGSYAPIKALKRGSQDVVYNATQAFLSGADATGEALDYYLGRDDNQPNPQLETNRFYRQGLNIARNKDGYDTWFANEAGKTVEQIPGIVISAVMPGGKLGQVAFWTVNNYEPTRESLKEAGFSDEEASAGATVGAVAMGIVESAFNPFAAGTGLTDEVLERAARKTGERVAAKYGKQLGKNAEQLSNFFAGGGIEFSEELVQEVLDFAVKEYMNQIGMDNTMSGTAVNRFIAGMKETAAGSAFPTFVLGGAGGAVRSSGDIQINVPDRAINTATEAAFRYPDAVEAIAKKLDAGETISRADAKKLGIQAYKLGEEARTEAARAAVETKRRVDKNYQDVAIFDKTQSELERKIDDARRIRDENPALERDDGTPARQARVIETIQQAAEEVPTERPQRAPFRRRAEPLIEGAETNVNVPATTQQDFDVQPGEPSKPRRRLFMRPAEESVAGPSAPAIDPEAIPERQSDQPVASVPDVDPRVTQDEIDLVTEAIVRVDDLATQIGIKPEAVETVKERLQKRRDDLRSRFRSNLERAKARQSAPQAASQASVGEPVQAPAPMNRPAPQAMETSQAAPAEFKPENLPETRGANANIVTDKEASWLVARIGKFFKNDIGRLIRSRGDLPSGAYEAIRARGREYQSYLSRVKWLKKEFDRMVGWRKRMRPEDGEILHRYLTDPKYGIENIPEDWRPLAEKLRKEVDKFSNRLVSEGVVSGKLADIVKSHIGEYLTRAYRIHNDPDWVKKIKPELRRRALDYFQKEFPGKSYEEVNRFMDEMLHDMSHGASALEFMAGNRLGKNLSIFKKRGDIPKVLRELWGEYSDAPMAEVAMTIQKIGWNISTQHMIDSIVEDGLGVYLSPNFTETFTEKIRKGDKSLGELGEMYTTPEIKKALSNLTDPQNVEEWLRWYKRANSFVKLSKTVVSPQTHVRNWISGHMFAVSQGDFKFWKYGKAYKMVLADLKRGGDWSQETKDYVDDLIRLGVLEDSGFSGEMRAYIQDVFGENESNLGAGRKAIKKTFGAVANLYKAEDAVHRVYIYENEYDDYRKALPEWTDEQVKQRASKITSMTYPTYSEAPELIKQLRHIPIVGTFPTFTWELLRTQVNTIRLIAEEARNPATRKIAARRSFGMFMAHVPTTAITTAVSMALGYDDDEDEAVRKFVYPWMEYSPFMYLTPESRLSPRMIDLSFSDPYAYFRKPAIAVMQNIDDPAAAISEALGELFEPFVNKEILFTKVAEYFVNQTETGRPIILENAPATDKILKTAQHFYPAFEPGVVTTGRRFAAAQKGVYRQGGRKYSLTDETIALLFGLRITTIDVKQSLKTQGKQFNREIREAEGRFSSVAGREGSIGTEYPGGPDELTYNFRVMSEARLKTFLEFKRTVNAAKTLGMTNDELTDVLGKPLQKGGAGLSKKWVRALVDPENEYPEYEISQYLEEKISRADEIARESGGESRSQAVGGLR